MAAKKTKTIEYPFVQTTRFGSVKIYRNEMDGKPAYVVSWVSESGRQKKTYRDESQAHLRAEEILEDLQRGMNYRQQITSAKAMALAECEKILEPFGASIQDAVSFYVAQKSKVAGNKILTLDAVHEYLKQQFTDTKSRHYRTAKSILFQFGRAFNKTLDSIVVKELDQYLKSVSVEGKTRNNHLGYVRTFFKWAQEWGGYLPEGKLEVYKVKPYPETKRRPDLYSPKEVEKLLVSAKNKMIPYLAIGAFAGVRSSEICRLTWDDIRIDQKVIRLGPEITKTESGRLAIMSDNLVEWLNAYNGERKGRVSPKPERQIHQLTHEVALAAGIEWKPNALRKGFISARMAQPNANAGVVAEECGNSPAMIKSNYRGLVLPDYADAWFNIRPVNIQ